MGMLSQLKSKAGARRGKKRLGRGHSSGHGGTSSKGHKGQKARKSGNVRRGFEGGQTPIYRRWPKFGFTNKAFKTEYDVVNVEDLQKFDKEVSPETLKTHFKLVHGKLKILGHGKLDKALVVKAHKFSKKAKEVIEKAGGKAEVIK